MSAAKYRLQYGANVLLAARMPSSTQSVLRWSTKARECDKQQRMPSTLCKRSLEDARSTRLSPPCLSLSHRVAERAKRHCRRCESCEFTFESARGYTC